jgi:hypothetical protein
MARAERTVRTLGRDDHISFERGMWKVQRVSWGLVALLLIASLFGAFGRGPLSSARATTSDGGLSVSYERFLRHSADTELRVRVREVRGQEIRVWLARTCFDVLALESVTPQPQGVTALEDRLVYSFRVGAGADEQVEFQFRFKVDKLGSVRGRAGIEGANGEATFRQYVYP